MMDFKAQMTAYAGTVNDAISRLIPPPETRPERLHRAMSYSLEAGGKRLRPILLLTLHEQLGGERDPLPAAVAIECLHTYSLIHDDLPAIDNSDLRRGRPTCHREFDEATAILAGDALLTLSFELLATHYATDLLPGLVLDLSLASGSRHLIGGQMEDILAEHSRQWGPEELEFIHRNKTAALIACSLTMGGRLADADSAMLERIRRMGEHLGLAYQLIDDLLDASGDTAVLGKPAGLDSHNCKTTAVSLYGLESTRQRAASHTRSALSELQELPGDCSFLAAMIRWMETRIS